MQLVIMGILTGVSLEDDMPLQKDGFQNYMYTVDDKIQVTTNINKSSL